MGNGVLIFSNSIFSACVFLLSLDMIATFSAYTDEEDQKYAETRFLDTGPYPQLKKVVQAKEAAQVLNKTGICQLKPGDFVVLCSAIGTYKKSRFPYEPYGLNESLIPEKCKQHPVKFHWEKLTTKHGEPKNKQDTNNYFTTRYSWRNETQSIDPLVLARKCPTTTESPKIWLSDGREKFAVFVYMRSCPGRSHIRLEDYVFFAENYYYNEGSDPNKI